MAKSICVIGTFKLMRRQFHTRSAMTITFNRIILLWLVTTKAYLHCHNYEAGFKKKVTVGCMTTGAHNEVLFWAPDDHYLTNVSSFMVLLPPRLLQIMHTSGKIPPIFVVMGPYFVLSYAQVPKHLSVRFS